MEQYQNVNDRIQQMKQLEDRNKKLETNTIKLQNMMRDKERAREMIAKEQNTQIMELLQNKHISEHIIETLQTQINEYQFELEQAKDTIEKQHKMYNALLKLTEKQRDSSDSSSMKNGNGQQATTINKQNRVTELEQTLDKDYTENAVAAASLTY